MNGTPFIFVGSIVGRPVNLQYKSAPYFSVRRDDDEKDEGCRTIFGVFMMYTEVNLPDLAELERVESRSPSLRVTVRGDI